MCCVCVLRGKREKPLQASWSNRWRTTEIALSSVRNYYPWKGSKDSAEFRLFGLKGRGITISNTTAFEKERWKCFLWVERGSAEGACWVVIVTHWDASYLLYAGGKVHPSQLDLPATTIFSLWLNKGYFLADTLCGENHSFDFVKPAGFFWFFQLFQHNFVPIKRSFGNINWKIEELKMSGFLKMSLAW